VEEATMTLRELLTYARQAGVSLDTELKIEVDKDDMQGMPFEPSALQLLCHVPVDGVRPSADGEELVLRHTMYCAPHARLAAKEAADG
jgi:hypothetical protein